MFKRMSHLSILVLAAAFAASAEEIALETAGEAAQAWVDGGYSLGTMRGRRMASGETVEAGGAKVHVVRFEGGGFVAMGADDLVDPVIAFSPSGKNLSRDDRSPLRAILGADLALRARAAARQEAGASAAKSGRTLLGAAAASSARTESQKRWDRLLGRGSGGAGLLRASTSSGPLDAVSDVRVEPLVKSRWGQENNSMYINYGKPCFNYYTPNNYPCGCVATAMAQIMRYHRYPASGAVVTNNCKVGTSAKKFTTLGGAYDYDSMPLVPEAYEDLPWYEGGATDAQREAIGKLTYDCGVMMQMWWGEGGSSSGGAAAGMVMTNNMFNYKNAVVNTCASNLGNVNARNRMIYPNLDAGMPVMLGLVGHQVIADGYGYSDGTLYTHLNMGWADECDVWYALPEVSTANDYCSSTIEAVIYNIFPTRTGEIVSGRVTDEDGNPVVGATIVVSNEQSTISTFFTNVTTSASGVYAFISSKQTQHSVNASFGSYSAATNVTPGTSRSSSVTIGVGACTVNTTASRNCGNIWGCDLVLPVPTVKRPVIDPGSNTDGSPCEFRRSTNVVITCATSDATIRYTTDGSDPTSMSPAYRAPVTIEHHTVLKARAFKTGCNPSPVATAEYFDPLEGDLYEQPILVSGTNGTHMVADNSGFGIETGEPRLTRYNEYHSCWYRWKSPGTGKIAFRVTGMAVADDGFNYFLPAVAVYNDVHSMSELALHPIDSDSGAESNYAFAEVKADVQAGKIYRIVGLQWGYSNSGYMRLSWATEPGFVIPPPPLSIRIR